MRDVRTEEDRISRPQSAFFLSGFDDQRAAFHDNVLVRTGCMRLCRLETSRIKRELVDLRSSRVALQEKNSRAKASRGIDNDTASIRRLDTKVRIRSCLLYTSDAADE